jgi:hypothetical protein
MRQIETSAAYPIGAQYALLTRSGESIQGFYKYADVKYNDGTTATVLFHSSEFPWAPSSHRTIEEVIGKTEGFEIVQIA